MNTSSLQGKRNFSLLAKISISCFTKGKKTLEKLFIKGALSVVGVEKIKTKKPIYPQNKQTPFYKSW